VLVQTVVEVVAVELLLQQVVLRAVLVVLA
jgi:hypothetical protein